MRRAALTVILAVLVPASTAVAGTDFLTGRFPGKWCNYDARFDIETQDAGTWVFHGRINILATGEYDPVWIEQYSDNSLRIIRYLQGANLGRTQVSQTYPPQTNVNNNVYYGQAGYGMGCEGTETILITPP